MDVITNLLTVEKELVEWIFASTPSTDDEKASLVRLLAERDKVTKSIDALMLKRLEVAALGPTDETKRLQQITEDIQSEAKTLDTIGKAIDYAGQVLKVTAAITALVASV